MHVPAEKPADRRVERRPAVADDDVAVHMPVTRRQQRIAGGADLSVGDGFRLVATHGLTVGCQRMDHARYWETAGATKTFTHPLDAGWLSTVRRTASVLDYGCGYGRLMAPLSDAGFERILGADTSAALIERGRRERPDLRFDIIGSPPAVAQPDGSFDLVLLFAVLTCVPGDDDQRALIAEIHRLLAPGGLLYVSDLLRQPDERSRRRYDARGVFTTEDGAVCRHHDIGHLRSLLRDFDLQAEQPVEVTSMNGHPAAAVQLLARRG